jgi:large subunit ribosomal protein L13
MRSYVAKPAEVIPNRKWWVVDATGQSLGRVASQVATILRGKHKATFTPHVDTGDFVVVINAKDAKVTGQKMSDKKYYHHSGYPGGLREETYGHLLERRPTEPMRLAVRGMLPKNALGRAMIKKLKIYAGAEHPHSAQNPATFKLSA